MFIALPSTATRKRGLSELLEYAMTALMIIILLLVIFTVINVIFVKNKLESQRQDLLDTLMVSYGAKFLLKNKWKICVDRLLDNKLFDFSFISLFSIDFNFLTTFFSSMVTISILFFQIENNGTTRKT